MSRGRRVPGTRRRAWSSLVLVSLACLATAGRLTAAVLFQDDFSGPFAAYDPAKWSLTGSNGQASIVAGVQNFTLAYNGSSGSSYLRSTSLSTLGAWTTLDIVGTWRLPAATASPGAVEPDFNIVLWDAAHSRTYFAGYRTWVSSPGSNLQFYLGNAQLFHPAYVEPPTDGMVPFRLRITPTGLEYYEGAIDQLIASYAATGTAAIQTFQIGIGGYTSQNVPHTGRFDSVRVLQDEPLNIPEPSMLFPALGALAFLRRRR